MDKIYLKARAKINLNLLITAKRIDNYHNILSVFQKINLYDEMYISKNNENVFKLETNCNEINNKENIIYKAYIKMQAKYKEIQGVTVNLNKRIPMQAGLGGGSTDCASFIIGINKLFNLKLTKKEMEKIGASLGADVVPCLYNKAVKVEGIGDIITKINTKAKYYLVVVKPDISCNTKEMYEKLDSKTSKIYKTDNTTKIIEALETSNIEELQANLHNDFEQVVDTPIINNIKNEFIKYGTKGCLMSGSGSSVYGIFKNKEEAKQVYKKIKNKYEAYYCISYNSKRKEQVC